ncbi:acetylglutamate kinase [Alienimonas californiensis]|uniref:acetylglutamate kinase n=1 Tax=Alienimonas californiensis TaxID=2527989 RepID=UPI0011A07583
MALRPAPNATDARERAIRDAETLLSAGEWIRAFRGRYVVVKLGGSALENEEAVDCLLADVRFMETVGLKPVLVHGGGKAISAAMAEAGLESKFVAGRRYTDADSLSVVAKTLAGISRSLAAGIERQGGKAVALCNFEMGAPDGLALYGRPLTLPGEDGQPLDLGLVGEAIGANHRAIEDVLKEDRIPVLPSLARDRRVPGPAGLLNVNADTAAAALARLLGAEKLVFLSDVAGLYADPHDESTLIQHLTADRAEELIHSGAISGGMIPKVEAALEALLAGVTKIHFVDGRTPHSVLLEIYSDSGVGTEIVADDPR